MIQFLISHRPSECPVLLEAQPAISLVYDTISYFPQAFRVSSATSSTARSSVSVVTLVLTVVDTNDNPPVWLNPTTQAIPIVEVSVLKVCCCISPPVTWMADMIIS